MGVKYNGFAKRGVDVSEFNENINWSILASKCDYVSIRVGYGNTIDSRFVKNIQEAIKHPDLDIFVYWYSDYYSNWFNKASPAYGLTDHGWGVHQANNCFQAIKPYKDRIKIVFLDIENITYQTFPKLTEPKANSHAQEINKAFLERMDALEVKNGIYASIGWISWFDDWFKDRILWGAFYPYRTANVAVADFKYMIKKNGWRGPALIWQYASDGDQDDNGTADGISFFGTSNKFMDLNGWVGTDTEYSELFGKEGVVVPEKPEEPPEHEKGLYLINAQPYLFIREKPIANETSKKVGLYYPGAKVVISSITGDWGLVAGQQQYIYLGYAEKIS